MVSQRTRSGRLGSFPLPSVCALQSSGGMTRLHQSNGRHIRRMVNHWIDNYAVESHIMMLKTRAWRYQVDHKVPCAGDLCSLVPLGPCALGLNLTLSIEGSNSVNLRLAGRSGPLLL